MNYIPVKSSNDFAFSPLCVFTTDHTMDMFSDKLSHLSHLTAHIQSNMLRDIHCDVYRISRNYTYDCFKCTSLFLDCLSLSYLKSIVEGLKFHVLSYECQRRVSDYIIYCLSKFSKRTDFQRSKDFLFCFSFWTK